MAFWVCRYCDANVADSHKTVTLHQKRCFKTPKTIGGLDVLVVQVGTGESQKFYYCCPQCSHRTETIDAVRKHYRKKHGSPHTSSSLVGNSYVEYFFPVEDPPVVHLPPVNNVPPVGNALPADYSPPTEDALPADVPSADDVPPIDDALPADDLPPVDITPPTDNVPPVDNALPVDNTPPANDVLPAHGTLPADDLPPIDIAPPTDNAPPVDNALPVDDLPPANDAPPADNVPDDAPRLKRQRDPADVGGRSSDLFPENETKSSWLEEPALHCPKCNVSFETLMQAADHIRQVEDPWHVFSFSMTWRRKSFRFYREEELNPSLPIPPEARRNLGLGGTMGGSIGSDAGIELDTSDPDSDIPDPQEFEPLGDFEVCLFHPRRFFVIFVFLDLAAFADHKSAIVQTMSTSRRR
ncbi:hypothetical protein BJ138DRAFT_1117574 [Hygrophoropsis aurantiaca]|uniref:Uncharacterized protein n=1 Tax=Hygrophoropsis aurantiaca TaxID=72124 RepID=A0ACB7ZZG1_9AGAM|nr:hypothetical protein BJ138DRAFT_1117574 [Hygrophoropsis aurantiaca]